MAAVLAVLALLLLIAAGTLAVLWRSAVLQVADLNELLTANLAELDKHQHPDDPTLLPAEVEQWLANRGDR